MSRVLDLRTETDAAIDAAISAITDGECIVLPTDTVYGIGANAFDQMRFKSCCMPSNVGATCRLQSWWAISWQWPLWSTR